MSQQEYNILTALEGIRSHLEELLILVPTELQKSAVNKASGCINKLIKLYDAMLKGENPNEALYLDVFALMTCSKCKTADTEKWTWIMNQETNKWEVFCHKCKDKNEDNRGNSS